MYAAHARALTVAKTAQARANAIQELRKKLGEQARRPTADEFEAGFSALRLDDARTTKKRLIKYILKRLDQQHASSASIDYEAMTIEHLAAQRPGGAGGASREHVAKIGNLALLSSRANVKLANKSFAEKKKALESGKAWIGADIKQATSWGDAEIDARTQSLAALSFATVWR
jgi:hypothetical protein